MSGTEETYHLTKEDVKKFESQASKVHGGNVPAGSDAAMAQSIVDQNDKDKKSIINERQANLPLPDDPPGKSDFNSSDQSTVNVGSGGVPTGGMTYGNDSLREPATGDSAVRVDESTQNTNVKGQGVGREGAEGLGGIPNDAVAQGSKNKSSLEDTTGKDYGYPQKSDPSSGFK
ncbi:hypothetical protein LTR37_002390 [Vermiconidia calcicola]|uniref:Uncharacterized protein n=1 Tax=Vermiconidia calcicola TaxID=1690605 RepID=A0ACC3NST4_9PEZI|nr:hypothetical protein LTR37_002390 [Vermiconidia calcicola]